MTPGTDRDARLREMLDAEPDMYFRRRAPLLVGWLDPQDGDRVLECGCGRGFFLNLIREVSGCALTGVELDEPTLRVAQESVGPKGVTVLRADVCALPFEDASFDKLLMTEVLEHVPDDRRALAEARRVMRPGATLAISVPSARYPFLWDPINRVREDSGRAPIRSGPLSGVWQFHVRLYRAEELRALAEEAGFVVEESRLLTYFAFPFIHNLVYGLGKELFQRGLLPASLASAADRFAFHRARPSPWNPIRLAQRAFAAVDSLNDVFPPTGSSVGIAMRLRKPS